MQPKFDLGQVNVTPTAERVLARAGQDADFFLEKHVRGDWEARVLAHNERAAREGGLVVSNFRTLRGELVMVFTHLGEKQTFVDCIREPALTIQPGSPDSTYTPSTSSEHDGFIYTISDSHSVPEDPGFSD